MKIEIDKILKYELLEKQYLSDDLLRFKIDFKDLKSQMLESYRKSSADANEDSIKWLEKEYLKNGYDLIGTRDELMEINLNHMLKADYYYTNGQNIVSIVIRDGIYELGVHKDIENFAQHLYPNYGIYSFSLAGFKLKTFHVFDFAEAEVTNILSALKIKRVPVLHDSNFDYLEIMKYHSSNYIFRYGDKAIQQKEDLANSMDRISLTVIKWLKPVVVKCCRNCKHFQYSGMSLDMGGGHAGYCMYPPNQLQERAGMENLRNIWSWCDKFEKNGKF